MADDHTYTNRVYYSKQAAADELGISVYHLNKHLESGMLDHPVRLEGIGNPQFTNEQLRAFRRRIEKRALGTPKDIKPIIFKPGESLV